MTRLQVFETVDRASAAVGDKGFYAPEALGRSRRLTPEGYLVCEGVPIARTGSQFYHHSELAELPLDPDENGAIRVERSADEVFRPDTMSSFEGKSITIEHPPEFVNPTNRKQYEVGHVQHVRRGDGDEDGLLLADLVVKDPLAIAYVNTKLPQLSCGYDAGYHQDRPGHARQQNIIGNHVALVQRGRAGPRVAIRDSISTPGETVMTKDAMLNAIDKGKQIKLGLVWEGGLKPRVDMLVDELKDLVTPITLGNVLTAESPGDIIDLGKVWDSLQALERAVSDAKAAKAAAPKRPITPADMNRVSLDHYEPNRPKVSPINQAYKSHLGGRGWCAELNQQAEEFYGGGNDAA